MYGGKKERKKRIRCNLPRYYKSVVKGKDWHEQGPVRLSACPPVLLSACPPVRLSARPPVRLSVPQYKLILHCTRFYKFTFVPVSELDTYLYYKALSVTLLPFFSLPDQSLAASQKVDRYTSPSSHTLAPWQYPTKSFSGKKRKNAHFIPIKTIFHTNRCFSF